MMNPPHSLHHHWEYTAVSNVTTPPTWTNVATGTRSVKRPLSESDDCDDVFSEGSSSKEQCTSPGDADSCQMLSRKKRRGVIEKKRRDRINTSLTELKRLVPSAFEKQGSAKLEKAEILQMTVDHLKMIHAKGLDTLAYDPHKFAMDYHNIGFRECATEVARYLVTIEGMDIQDPLRLRLMSHLQCFAAQRELASKQAASVSPWGYGSSSQNYPASSLNPIPSSPSHSNHPSSSTNLSHHQPPPSALPPPPPPPVATAVATSALLHHNVHDLNNHFDISTSCAQSPVVPTSSNASIRQSHSQPSSTSILTPLTTVATTSSPAFGYTHHQYSNLNTFGASSPGNIVHHQNYNQANSSAQMKPYRPWGGAEVAY